MMSFLLLIILGEKRQQSMQTAHLCTVWAGRQLFGEVGRQKGTMYACMKVTDMQIYANTYRHVCVQIRVSKWEASTEELEVFQHASGHLN